DDRGVIEIKPSNGPIRFRSLRLFLDMYRQTFLVEFKNAVASGIVYPMTKDGGVASVVGSVLHEVAQAGAIKDIVSKNKRAALSIDELLANDEGFGDAIGSRLHRVTNADAPLT